MTLKLRDSWDLRCNSSWVLLSNPLWPGVVVPVQVPLLHTYIYWIHTGRNDNRRMINDRRTNKGRRKTSLTIFLPLTLLQGFERVVQGLHVRGWWRPNINFIFWPHCYDRHIVSFLFSWCWGPRHRGSPEAPSVGCGFPTTSGLYSLEVCWQLLWDPNSTELNNNSTPTRSPTGSLKLNVLSSSSGNNCHAVQRLLSSGASL